MTEPCDSAWAAEATDANSAAETLAHLIQSPDDFAGASWHRYRDGKGGFAVWVHDHRVWLDIGNGKYFKFTVEEVETTEEATKAGEVE